MYLPAPFLKKSLKSSLLSVPRCSTLNEAILIGLRVEDVRFDLITFLDVTDKQAKSRVKDMKRRERLRQAETGAAAVEGMLLL